MKVVILAGGMGTRFAEETQIKPKPMIEIGGRPILWHILSIYSHYGLREFIVCLGFKGYVIKEYFANYCLHNSDVTVDLASNSLQIHHRKSEDWLITMIDTGPDTLTGGRVKRVAPYITGDTFCLTYGDGVGDINVGELLQFHSRHGKWATVTATRPPARFGALRLAGSSVSTFEEKPIDDGGWINGGFFVARKEVLDLIEGDRTEWERDTLHKLAAMHQLEAYQHHGFWQPMDTLREKNYLEQLWQTGKAPWKLWE